MLEEVKVEPNKEIKPEIKEKRSKEEILLSLLQSTLGSSLDKIETKILDDINVLSQIHTMKNSNLENLNICNEALNNILEKGNGAFKQSSNLGNTLNSNRKEKIEKSLNNHSRAKSQGNLLKQSPKKLVRNKTESNIKEKNNPIKKRSMTTSKSSGNFLKTEPSNTPRKKIDDKKSNQTITSKKPNQNFATTQSSLKNNKLKTDNKTVGNKVPANKTEKADNKNKKLSNTMQPPMKKAISSKELNKPKMGLDTKSAPKEKIPKKEKDKKADDKNKKGDNKKILSTDNKKNEKKDDKNESKKVPAKNDIKKDEKKIEKKEEPAKKEEPQKKDEKKIEQPAKIEEKKIEQPPLKDEKKEVQTPKIEEKKEQVQPPKIEDKKIEPPKIEEKIVERFSKTEEKKEEAKPPKIEENIVERFQKIEEKKEESIKIEEKKAQEIPKVEDKKEIQKVENKNDITKDEEKKEEIQKVVEPKIEENKVEENKMEENKVEENKVEEKKDEMKVDTPKEEEKKEDPQKQEDKKEEEKPKLDEVKKEELPIVEEKKEEQPKIEEPKIKTPLTKTEIICKNIKPLCKLLPIEDKFKLSKLNKAIMKATIDSIIEDLNQQIKPFENKVEELKKSYSEDKLKEPIPAFALGKGGLRAIGILNNEMYLNLFEDTSTVPAKEIIVLFRIYMQLMKKDELCQIKDDSEFWKKCASFIIEETKKNDNQMGKSCEQNIKTFDYSDENIHQLIKMVEPYTNILTPAYYTKECPTAGVYCFFIKDALEYCGALPSKKPLIPRLYQNAIYDLNKQKSKIDKLQKLKNI